MKLKVLNIIFSLFIMACGISSCLDSDVTEYEFNMFDIKIVGFEDDHKSLPLAMGAYISVTEGSTTEYSYIQNSSPNKDEIYSFVSYNDIVNPKEVI